MCRLTSVIYLFSRSLSARVSLKALDSCLLFAKIRANKKLAKAFKVEGDISFTNHSNGLSEEERVVSGKKELHVASSPSTLAKPTTNVSQPVDGFHAGVAKTDQKNAESKVYAELFCVSTIDGQRVPRLVLEYKPPHKVSVETMYAGLRDIKPFEEVINRVATVTTPSDEAEL